MSKEEWSRELWQYIGALCIAVFLPPLFCVGGIVYLIVKIIQHFDKKPAVEVPKT